MLVNCKSHTRLSEELFSTFSTALESCTCEGQLAIFPGFEISCHGAEKGPIHVIGIFDPGKSQADLERVLGKLDVKKTGEESLTSKSVTDVVNIIRQYEGLPVLAHANSSHGALSDIRGNPRTDLVQNPSLLAVEATGGDFEKPVGSRLVDYLNGEDPGYQQQRRCNGVRFIPSPNETTKPAAGTCPF
jgi:hypothetical protein